jgi:hypothetical protein
MQHMGSIERTKVAALLFEFLTHGFNAFHNYVPGHRSHAERVACIFKPSAGKYKGTTVP